MGGDQPEGEVDLSTSSNAPGSPTLSASPTPPATLEIEFTYQAPDTPCPPVSKLSTLASAENHPYALSHTFLDDGEDLDDAIRSIVVTCEYQPAATVNDDAVLIPDDHVWFWAWLTLYPTPDHPSLLSWALPVPSDDVHAWGLVDIGFNLKDESNLRDEGVWREGCGPDATPCAEGEEPTVQTHEWYDSTSGHVGNLNVRLESRYIAVDLPPDAEQTIVDIYREFVLAIVDSWEHAE